MDQGCCHLVSDEPAEYADDDHEHRFECLLSFFRALFLGRLGHAYHVWSLSVSELDGFEYGVVDPCFCKSAREKRMTAVEADPTGEVPIEVVERGSSGMGEVNA